MITLVLVGRQKFYFGMLACQNQRYASATGYTDSHQNKPSTSDPS
jgi:hypothetical protein